MTETQKRIEAYQKLLPDIKEKVMAVAMLLALSVIMLTSASFAWLTLSRAPEVTSVATNVAANGNLEIALATGDGTTPPGESEVGDSMATEGKENPVVSANITWGNLINLNDPSYGLDKIELKPAQLGGDLNNRPLSTVRYDSEGRIKDIYSDFGFATWYKDENGVEFFKITGLYGVRAISSIVTKDTGTAGAAIKFNEMYNGIVSSHSEVNKAYGKEGLQSDEYMVPLIGIVEKYVQKMVDEKLSYTNNSGLNVKELTELQDTYKKLLEVFDEEADVIAETINAMIYAKNGVSGEYTRADVYNLTSNDINGFKNDGIVIEGLSTFISDHKKVLDDKADIDGLVAKGESVSFDDIFVYVNRLVNIDTCKINNKTISELSSDIMGALSMLNSTVNVKVYNGILKNFEDRTGLRMEVTSQITIDTRLLGKKNPKVIITTSSDKNYYNKDILLANKLFDEGDHEKPEETAQDTFGIAIDLWVRTNATNSYLVLEGEVKKDSAGTAALTTKDAAGNTVPVYEITRQSSGGLDGSDIPIEMAYKIYETKATLWFIYDGTDNSEEIILEDGEAPSKTDETATVDGKKVSIFTIQRDDTTYKIFQEEDYAWFEADSHLRFVLEDGEEPKPVTTEIYNVSGFEGENRVWNDGLLTSDSTTQGTGSCYIYYAETPEDHKKSLEMLKHVEVAFSDVNGNKIATAYMDTENAYEDNGRITVPLVLNSGIVIGTDNGGKKIYGIKTLEQNEATRITAIVYLNGENLGNDAVLSQSSISGQLNIQFGSSQNLVPIENEKLELSTMTVSAKVSKNEFSFDSDNLETTVTLTIESTTEPKEVKAFFLRSINETQGTRENTMTFTKKTEKTWECNYTFTAPGNYVLKTVEIDGQEYVLKNQPTVKVNGFSITDVRSTHEDSGNITIMTADSSFKEKVTVIFGTDEIEKMPAKVQGRFVKTDGSVVDIIFKHKGEGVWEGEANFLTSGEYTLTYLILDNNYTEIAKSLWITANVKLGMIVSVETTSPKSFKLVEEEMTDGQKRLHMEVEIMDNTGEKITGLTGVWLHYSKTSGTSQIFTEIRWNGTFYEGDLLSLEAEFGRYEFSKVTVSGNNISKATEAPVFTFMSPEPPKYISDNTPESQYAGYNDAYMTAIISNSDAAEVRAYIKGETGSEIGVSPVKDNTSVVAEGDSNKVWKFLVPSDGTGSQHEGTYTLTRLEIWGVFDESGREYTVENPMEITVPESDPNTTYVYKTINTTVLKYEGKTDFEGECFEVHGVEGDKLKVTLLNKKGNHLVYNGERVVKEAKLIFSHVEGSSLEKGGYTSDQLSEYTIEAELTCKNADGTFSNADPVEFIYAGKYVTTLTYTTIKGETVTFSSGDGSAIGKDLPVFTVSSTAPSVKITGISPTGTMNVDRTDNCQKDDTDCDGNITSNKNGHVDKGATASYTDTTANVYFKCTRGSTIKGNHNYTRPSVTITLADYGSATKAELKFGNDVQIYDGTTKTTGYSWIKNGACARNIGYYSGSTTGTDTKTTAGTLTASTLVLTHDGKTFEVTISTITINNPY